MTVLQCFTHVSPVMFQQHIRCLVNLKERWANVDTVAIGIHQIQPTSVSTNNGCLESMPEFNFSFDFIGQNQLWLGQMFFHLVNWSIKLLSPTPSLWSNYNIHMRPRDQFNNKYVFPGPLDNSKCYTIFHLIIHLLMQSALDMSVFSAEVERRIWNTSWILTNVNTAILQFQYQSISSSILLGKHWLSRMHLYVQFALHV